jgi:uracil-DNA glycosylase
MAAVELPEGWRVPLSPVWNSEAIVALRAFLAGEIAAGKRIYPDPAHWLRALELTPLDAVKVVILGQDPYHGPGQAHGLCFSVQPGVRVPPSLANIYKEQEGDLGLPRPRTGFLEPWARQGVLLLNSLLTVEDGKPAAHKGRGWEGFTDAIIRLVDAKTDPVVFMLWGDKAKAKADFVDAGRHLVLTAAHPSPLSARKFLGCRHFSQCNAFLEAHGTTPIDWRLSA